MADTDSLDQPLRMDAYYYNFNRTGVLAIDRVLSAVATAGKHYHHTESWGDQDDAESETGRIQAAANEAASYARSLESQLADRPSVDAILDFEWREGRPHTAHRQHQFYYDCAVCQGDVKAMLTLTRPE